MVLLHEHCKLDLYAAHKATQCVKDVRKHGKTDTALTTADRITIATLVQYLQCRMQDFCRCYLASP